MSVNDHNIIHDNANNEGHRARKDLVKPRIRKFCVTLSAAEEAGLIARET